jgi:hypothetical protein
MFDDVWFLIFIAFVLFLFGLFMGASIQNNETTNIIIDKLELVQKTSFKNDVCKNELEMLIQTLKSQEH